MPRRKAEVELEASKRQSLPELGFRQVPVNLSHKMADVGLGDLIPFFPLLERLADAIQNQPQDPGRILLAEAVELLHKEVKDYTDRTKSLEEQVVDLHEQVAYLEGFIEGLSQNSPFRFG